MSIRSERIRQLVESSNLSYVELEKITGIKKSSLQRYASGRTAKIPLDVIEKLANTFHVSQQYLMGWDEEDEISPDQFELTEGEKDLIMLFRQIPEEQQRVFLEMGRVYADSLKTD